MGRMPSQRASSSLCGPHGFYFYRKNIIPRPIYVKY
jgi:hypothetical protein